MDKGNIKTNFRIALTESSLSRIMRHIVNNDTAIISAFRGNYDLSENKRRSIELKAFLLKDGFGVTPVKGAYVENYNTELAKEVNEDSLFVVNLKADSGFFDKLAAYGTKYEQDCVIFILKGGNETYLLGTNDSGFPGLGQKVPQGHFKPKIGGEFMTKYKNQPFTFGEEINEALETYEGLSRLSKMAIKGIIEKGLI